MAIVDELIAVLGFELEGEKNLKRFQKEIDGIDKKLNSFAKGVAKYGTMAAAAGATLFAALGRSVINTSAQIEGFQTALVTIEGSAEQASKSMDWIAEFGKTTPYDIAGVTDAFIKLKAYGIDPIANDALRTLGDTASAMNKPLNQAVEAFADASTFEFERLKEFGIRATQAGEEVTFSWTKNGKQLSRVVKKNGEDVRKFLLENMGERFSGAMIRQSKTWTGMMSNLGDSWTMFQKRIGDKGFFDTVKNYLGGVLDKVDELDANGTLDRWATNLSNTFEKGFGKVLNIVARLARHAEFLGKNFEKLEGPIYAVATALGVLLARAYPVLTVLVLLGLAIDDILTYLEGGESVYGKNVKDLEESLNISTRLAEGIAAVLGSLGAILAAGLALAPMKTFKVLRAGFSWVFRSLGKNFVGFGGQLMSSLRMGLVVGLAALLAYIFRDELTRTAMLYITMAFAQIKMLFGNEVMNWAIDGAAKVAQAIEFLFANQDAFANQNWVMTFFVFGQLAMSKLAEGLSSGATSVWNYLKGLPAEIDGYLLSLDFFKSGQQMMDSLFNGMKSIGDSIKGWFQNLIPDWALKFVGGGVEIPESAQTGVANMSANMSKTTPTAAAATVNEIQDNRDQSISNQITINQTVTQAAEAPGAAASATGNAVKNAASQRSQLETEPLMQ